MGDEGGRAGVAREGTGAEVTAVDAAEAAALARFRSEFLEAHFVAPAVREFIDRAGQRPA